MMQRRNPQVGKGHKEVGLASPLESARIGRPLGSASSSRKNSVSPWILVAIAAALMVATYKFPEIQQANDAAVQGAYATEQKIEQDMISWWSSNGHQKPPIPVSARNVLHTDHRNVAELRKAATERMLSQESKWVDGEKKLKAKLKLLAARQQEGKDLGVPVATRWVGDDIPAWAGEGVDVDAWNAKIKERYDLMRQDEDHWREMVMTTLKSNNRG